MQTNTKYPKFLRHHRGNLWYTTIGIPSGARWAFSGLDKSGRLTTRLSGETFKDVIAEHRQIVAATLSKVRLVSTGARKPMGRSPSLEQYTAAVDSGKFSNQVEIAAHFNVVPSTITTLKQRAARAAAAEGATPLPAIATATATALTPSEPASRVDTPYTRGATTLLAAYARRELIPDLVGVLKTAVQARKHTRDFMRNVLEKPDPQDAWVEEVRAELAYLIQLLGAP